MTATPWMTRRYEAQMYCRVEPIWRALSPSADPLSPREVGSCPDFADRAPTLIRFWSVDRNRIRPRPACDSWVTRYSLRAHRKSESGMCSASQTVILTLAMLGAVSAPTAAQAPVPAWATGAPVDVADLVAGPHSTMEMLYERTIFRIDVLHLTIVLGAATTAGIEPVVSTQSYSNELAASLAETVLEARDVLIRTRFLRNLTIRQFLDGTAENLTAAQDGGLITDEERGEMLADMELAWEPYRGTRHPGRRLDLVQDPRRPSRRRFSRGRRRLYSGELHGRKPKAPPRGSRRLPGTVVRFPRNATAIVVQRHPSLTWSQMTTSAVGRRARPGQTR